ncbi:MAG: hypothetical protein WBR32_06945, partial [Pseudolabrys sp.]
VGQVRRQAVSETEFATSVASIKSPGAALLWRPTLLLRSPKWPYRRIFSVAVALFARKLLIDCDESNQPKNASTDKCFICVNCAARYGGHALTE